MISRPTVKPNWPSWGCIAAVLLVTPAYCQFSNTINVPPQVAPRSIGSNTQLNVSEGGKLGFGFDAGVSDGSSRNVELNLLDGSTAGSLFAHGGSTINMSGGTAGGIFAKQGSSVNVSGGVFDGFTPDVGSRVTVIGDEFRLNNELVDKPTEDNLPFTLTVPAEGLLSGVLEDGTPFGISPYSDISNGIIFLDTVDVPTVERSVIRASSQELPNGVRDGQTLIVDNGAIVPPHFRAGFGSEIKIEFGGKVEKNLKVFGGHVRLANGNIDGGFELFDGSTATIESGSISGNYSGFVARRGSTVELRGGSIGRLDARSGSMVSIYGGEFRMDGELIRSIDIDSRPYRPKLEPGSLLTGRYESGAPFAFYLPAEDEFLIGDRLAPDVVSLHTLELPAFEAKTITLSPTVPPPLGIGHGQTLVIPDGTVLPENFVAGTGSAVRLQDGGHIEQNFKAVNSQVTVEGGILGWNMHAFDDSDVRVIGGSIGSFRLFDSSMTVIGGEVAGIEAYGGAKVTITGGELGAASTVGAGFLTGGIFAYSGSEIEIIGREFFVDNAQIPGLTEPGDSVVLSTGDDGFLTGALVDGNEFFLDLSSNEFDFDYFDSESTLRVTLAVPEPEIEHLIYTTCILSFGLHTLIRRQRVARTSRS